MRVFVIDNESVHRPCPLNGRRNSIVQRLVAAGVAASEQIHPSPAADLATMNALANAARDEPPVLVLCHSSNPELNDEDIQLPAPGRILLWFSGGDLTPNNERQSEHWFKGRVGADADADWDLRVLSKVAKQRGWTEALRLEFEGFSAEREARLECYYDAVACRCPTDSTLTKAFSEPSIEAARKRFESLKGDLSALRQLFFSQQDGAGRAGQPPAP